MVRRKREYVNKLVGVGGMFFVVQLAGLLIFQTNILIIAHQLGASQVTPYSVTYRLFTYTVLIQSLVTPTLWPAFGEALARRDTVWISRALRLNLVLSPLAAAFFALPLVMFGDKIIAAWAGIEAVPPNSLLLLMGIWSVIYAFTTALGTFLNGVGHLRGQMVYGMTTAVANVGLTILVIRAYGLNGAIAGTIVAYLIFAIIPASVETTLVFRRLKFAT